MNKILNKNIYLLIRNAFHPHFLNLVKKYKSQKKLFRKRNASKAIFTFNYSILYRFDKFSSIGNV